MELNRFLHTIQFLYDYLATAFHRMKYYGRYFFLLISKGVKFYDN